MYRDITKTNKNVQRQCTNLYIFVFVFVQTQMCLSLRHYKDKQKCTETLQIVETLQRQTKMYRDITKTTHLCLYLRHYKDKQKCTETLQIVCRDITKTNKNVQRHYKDKQNVFVETCTKTNKNVQRHVQRQTKMYRDITKTNKNVQRHYKDKQKCTESERQTHLCLSL